MGLRADLRGAVTTIMAALGDLAEDVVFESVSVGNYDPATDANTVTTTTVNCTGFLYRKRETQMDTSKAIKYVLQVLLQYDDLESVIPKESDYITVSGVRYEVTDVKTIPRDSGYILTVRKP